MVWCHLGKVGALEHSPSARHFLDQLCVRLGAVEADKASQEPVDSLLFAVKGRYMRDGLLEGRFSA
jgi:hypothetical protein